MGGWEPPLCGWEPPMCGWELEVPHKLKNSSYAVTRLRGYAVVYAYGILSIN